ncbi:hypothetical protein [Streptomyces sp. CB01635]
MPAAIITAWREADST